MGTTARVSISISDVLDHFGVKRSKDRCACPIHKGSNQYSFWFSDDGYFCHSCGAKGNSISLIAAILGVGFPEAIRYAKEHLGYSTSSSANAIAGFARTHKRSEQTTELLILREHQACLQNESSLVAETLSVFRDMTERGVMTLNDFQTYEPMLIERSEEIDEERIAVHHQIKSLMKGGSR